MEETPPEKWHRLLAKTTPTEGWKEVAAAYSAEVKVPRLGSELTAESSGRRNLGAQNTDPLSYTKPFGEPKKTEQVPQSAVPKQGPFSGLKTRTSVIKYTQVGPRRRRFFCRGVASRCSWDRGLCVRKVRTAWAWWSVVELTACRDKKPLRVNLDETACRLHYEQRAGLVLTPRQGSTRKRQRVVQDVSTKRRRGGFTHIAMICDDPSIQPCLP